MVSISFFEQDLIGERSKTNPYMLSAKQLKQGSIWYHFYNVFGMARSGIEPMTLCSRGKHSSTDSPFMLIIHSNIIPETIQQCIFCWDFAHVDESIPPDAVPGEHVLHLVNTLAELGDELVDVVHQAYRQVLKQWPQRSLLRSSKFMLIAKPVLIQQVEKI